MSGQLLWADDDTAVLLRALLHDFHSAGFVVQTVRNFSDGCSVIRSEHSKNTAVGSVLVDINLPDGSLNGKIETFLGLRLADLALENGARKVAFLSGVPQSTVEPELAVLLQKASALGAEIIHVDKTMLLEPNVIEELVRFLQVERREAK